MLHHFTYVTMSRCISAYNLITALPYYYTLHIILFLHLLSINHKCTQPCYFPLLYKPIAQKVKMDWNFLMRSSRLALPRLISCGLWSLPLFCLVRVVLVLRDIIYVIIILYLWHLAICEHFISVCVWNTWSWTHMRWVLDVVRKIRYDRLWHEYETGWGN
jgi:hypothetical protein